MEFPLRVAIAGYIAPSILKDFGVATSMKRSYHPANWVLLLARALSQEAMIELRVFTYTNLVDSPRLLSADNLSIQVLPRYEPVRISALCGHIFARRKFGPYIKAFEPDVVHGFGTESGYGLIATDQVAPSVIFIQGIVSLLRHYSTKYSRLHNAIRASLEQKAIKRADALVVESDFAEEWIRSFHTGARIAKIPHIINPIFFRNSSDFTGNYCLYVGSLTNIKGVDIAIRAIAETTSTSLSMRVIGSGPLRSEVHRLSRTLGIEKRISFLGFQSHDRIAREMARARFVLVPSRIDNSPNIITEAHAMGLPVIAAKSGGIPEKIRDGLDGYLVDSEDYKKLAVKMDALYNDQQLSISMGRRGKARALRMNSIESIVDKHVALYRGLLCANIDEG